MDWIHSSDQLINIATSWVVNVDKLNQLHFLLLIEELMQTGVRIELQEIRAEYFEESCYSEAQ